MHRPCCESHPVRNNLVQFTDTSWEWFDGGDGGDDGPNFVPFPWSADAVSPGPAQADSLDTLGPRDSGLPVCRRSPRQEASPADDWPHLAPVVSLAGLGPCTSEVPVCRLGGRHATPRLPNTLTPLPLLRV